MAEHNQVQILLIWVNAERQTEREFIEALQAHPDFTRPEVVERDSHQAEISASFPHRSDVLEAIIDALLGMPTFDIRIQGAETERVPTVVFSATPLRGRKKPNRPRGQRRHFDIPPYEPAPGHHAVPERVLSTTEMAQESGPSPHRRSHATADPHDEPLPDHGVVAQIRPAKQRSVQPRPSKLLPTLKKIAKVIFIEEEPADEQNERSGPRPDHSHNGDSPAEAEHGEIKNE